MLEIMLRFQIIPLSTPGLDLDEFPNKEIKELNGVKYLIARDGNIEPEGRPDVNTDVALLMNNFPGRIIDYRIHNGGKCSFQVYDKDLYQDISSRELVKAT